MPHGFYVWLGQELKVEAIPQYLITHAGSALTHAAKSLMRFYWDSQWMSRLLIYYVGCIAAITILLFINIILL